jgi:hypothetical protein
MTAWLRIIKWIIIIIIVIIIIISIIHFSKSFISGV